MIDDLLLQVNKPGRYIAGEWNAARKDFDKSRIRIALCFPDLYEIGMSNFGMRIIYGLLNSIPDVSCERVFHPGLDMESLMRSKPLEIFSLESRRKLTDFDIVGFSLGYELNYTNLLNILDLGGIPLLSSMRGDDFPLVIAGGSSSLNPEPVADFLDLFVIGEAEEAVREIIDLCRKEKEKAGGRRPSKRGLLYALAQLEGVYVPSLYDVSYNTDGTLKSFLPKSGSIAKRIKKRIIHDINQPLYPASWMVPYIQIVHDRITLEVMRGCPNRCRFCQARSLYYPCRQKAPSEIINLAKQVYALTGYEGISLLGLSVCDYHRIKELVSELIGVFEKDAVGISLPSIKPRENTKELLALIAKVKKTSLTLAPEAATPRLRKIINKDFNREDFFNTIEQAYRLGYKHVKLYFMIGLPGENSEDLDGIAELSREVSDLKIAIDKKCAEVNVSIATFIPKPHTPFQWLGMDGLSAIEDKQDYLRQQLRGVVSAAAAGSGGRQIVGLKGGRKGKIKIGFHNSRMSFVEGVLSRGDRRLSRLILDVWDQGARFDAWENYFSFEKWMQGFQRTGLNPDFYLTRMRPAEELFPWDFIDSGISKQELRSEWEEAGVP